MYLLTADDFYSRLHDAGWSVGDVAFKVDGQRVWMVYCHRGEQKIIAKRPSQRDAWEAAYSLLMARPFVLWRIQSAYGLL